MASRHCPNCEDQYPDHKTFDLCPICGAVMKYKVGADAIPTVSFDEGERRIRYREGLKKFNEWDAKQPTLPIPHVPTIHSQRRHNYIDRAKARLVFEAIQGQLVHGGEGPVDTGSIPYAVRVLPVDEIHLFA